MEVTGNPVIGVLEVVVLAVGQAVAHELLSTLEFPTLVNRLVIPLHAAGERDLLEIRVEYKFRANRAAANLGWSQVEVVDFLVGVVGPLVPKGKAKTKALPLEDLPKHTMELLESIKEAK